MAILWEVDTAVSERDVTFHPYPHNSFHSLNVKSKSHDEAAHLHAPTNVPTKLSTYYTLQFSPYSLGKILKVTVTTARSKFKPTTKYELILHFMVSKILPDRTIKVKVKGQIKILPITTHGMVFFPSTNIWAQSC